MENIHVQLPLDPEQIKTLRAGDTVLLTGVLYTARDAAHKRLVACLDEGRPLPFDLKNQLIYYVGPAPASPGHPVGSAGPTTSYRKMCIRDSFSATTRIMTVPRSPPRCGPCPARNIPPTCGAGPGPDPGG